MKKLLTALAIGAVMTSCQKEISVDNLDNLPGGGGGNSNGGTQLFRIGVRTGADSITTNFTYNRAGRLTTFAQTGTISGVLGTAQVQYVRNAAEVITKSIVKTNALAQFGLDSIEAFHTYDAVNKRYNHSVSAITIMGFTGIDSTVFVYTGDKLTTAINYYDEGFGGGFQIYSKGEYSYSGDNISQVKSYVYDEGSGSYELEETVNYEYDTKINPVHFPADAPLMSMLLFYSANNAVKTTTTDHLSGTTEVTTTRINYTANNRPLVAVGTNGTANAVSTYYYR